jgi:UDP-galactopyranose mutase
MKKKRFLIVGSGFAGSVAARELADAGHAVSIIDKRPHIGGNAYDTYDAHGILIHPYGPHIFHTNSERVFQWLSRFTEWRHYEHRVLAEVNGVMLPMPINRTTINGLYGFDLDVEGVAAFLEKTREPKESIKTSEDVVLNSVGSDLCDKFFRGYTRKQWGLDLSELGAGVAARIPTRTNDDDRYFTDTYQVMPKYGYTRMFQQILNHPLIHVMTGTDYSEYKVGNPVPNHTVYTGPIDAYFNHQYGPLPYRSLRFDHEHRSDITQYQAVGTVNYPNTHEYTRITEFKHLTGQEHAATSIMREYPQASGDPYYPIPRPENDALYRKYQVLADSERDVTFVGRLAQYRYYNMDQVVAAALTLIEKLKKSIHS